MESYSVQKLSCDIPFKYPRFIVMVCLLLARIDLCELRHVQHLQDQGTHRFARSPQMPPTVTARKPYSRESDQFHGNMIDVSIGVQSVPVAPPTVVNNSASKEKVPNIKSSTHKSSNSLPNSPMVATLSKYNVDESDSNMLVLSDDAGSQANSKHLVSASFKSTSNLRNSETAEQEDCEISKKDPIKFSTYQEALKSVNVSPSKAIRILKQKGVTFEEFTNFIEGGATREQILQILYVPKSKSKDENTLNKTPDLTDFFTEIVHEVPARGSYKNYDSSFPSDKQKKKKKAKKYQKKYASGSKHQIYHGDINDIPAKDSPMVSHFRERNSPSTVGSAAILSVSIEEKPTKPPPKSTTKIVATKNKTNMLPKEEPSSEIGYILPVKGIILVSGIIGAVAFFTSLSLAIYTAFSCKKMPIESTYTLNTQDKPEEIEC